MRLIKAKHKESWELMKKVIALAISVILVVSILAGCSSNELGFYNTMKAMDALKNYNYSGSISLKINKLEAISTSTTDGEFGSTDELSLMKSMLNNSTITYDGSVDSVNDKIVFNVGLKSGDGTFDMSANMIVDDSNNGCLLDISPEIANMIIPVGLDNTDVTINGIEYYQYDITKIIGQINAMQPTAPVITNPYDESTQKVLYDAYTVGFNDGYTDGYSYNDDNSENYTGDSKAYEDGYQQGTTNIMADNNEESLKAMVPSLQSLTTFMNATSDQKDLQSKLSSLEDELMNTYFTNLKVGLITKTGDSTYSCNAGITDLYSAFKNVMLYVQNNPDQLKTILSNFVNSLSDSQFTQLFGLVASSKSDVIDLINQTDLSNLENDVQDMDSLVKEITDSVSLKIGFTLQKVASNSYSISDTLSVNNNSEPNPDLSIDLTLNQNTLINGGGKANDIGGAVSALNLTASKPTVDINITDPNVVNTGILISSNKNMSDSKKLSATKQGKNYVVDLSSVKNSTKYYYEVYTIDTAGNLLTSKQVSTLQPLVMASNLIDNPDTADNTKLPVGLIFLCLSAATMSILILRKKLKKI